MANEIRTFEDLDAWTIAREVTKLIYALTREGVFAKDFGLLDQIRRAAVSIMSNIAEGFERSSNKDFAKFLFIAKGSAGEVRSLLYVAQDQGYITPDQFQEAFRLCIRSSQTVWGLIKTLRQKSNWITGMQILFFAVLPVHILHRFL